MIQDIYSGWMWASVSGGSYSASLSFSVPSNNWVLAQAALAQFYIEDTYASMSAYINEVCTIDGDQRKCGLGNYGSMYGWATGVDTIAFQLDVAGDEYTYGYAIPSVFIYG